MLNLLDPISSPNFHKLIYVDDLLTFSSASSDHCNHLTNSARSAISQAGFMLHPPGSDKSTLHPSTSITFLGKHIHSGASPSITNSSTTNHTSLFYSLIASTFTLKPSYLRSIFRFRFCRVVVMNSSLGRMSCMLLGKELASLSLSLKVRVD